jgi:hypothetical protein
MAFVTTFLVAMIGLVWFRIWNAESVTVDWVLLGVSVVLALLLMFPTFADLVRKGAVSERLDAIDEKIGRIQSGLTALAAASDLKAVVKQLGPEGDVARKLDAMDQRAVLVQAALDAAVSGTDVKAKQLKRLTTQLNEQTALLTSIKGQLGDQGEIQTGLQSLAGAKGDAEKVETGIAALQKAVNKLNASVNNI